MKKIFMIVFSNIRKTKTHTVILILMFMVSAMLLNLGLLIITNFGPFFDQTASGLHTADVCYIMPSKLHTADVDNYLRNNSNIVAMEETEAFIISSDVKYNGNDRSITFLAADTDAPRNISQWKTVGDARPLNTSLADMPVYLPNVFAINGGYRIDDKLTLNNGNKSAVFTVKGFIEDIYFSQLDTGMPVSLYMPHAVYENAFSELSPEDHATVVFANLRNLDKTVEAGIRGINQDINISTTDLSSVKLMRTMVANATAAMAVAFSMIIAIVCLIIVWFGISNSIEEEMAKIGSLKAAGYTSRQIMLTVISQNGMIALAGSFLGILLSYLFIPVITDVFAVQTGLIWEQGFDGSISGFALLFIMTVIAGVSFLVARRIRKISPIAALRGGIATHSFRKNHMPLDKSRGNLPLRLGIKSNLQNMRQSLTIMIITLAVGFSGAFGMVLFYNTMIDTSTFAEMPGLELSDVSVVFNPAQDNSAIVSDIRNMPHVQKVQYMDTDNVKIDSSNASVTVMQDYSTKNTNTVYEGRYPKHRNEIVLNGSFARLMNKKTGDGISLAFGDKRHDFIITGLSQGMSGSDVSITLDGMELLNPDFSQTSLQIYLDKGTDAESIVDSLQKEYGDRIISVTNVDKAFKNGMGPFINIISKVGIAIMAVTIFVVLLVLYFVLVSSIIRRRRELGIQKAIGFTTLQLMNQVSVSLILPILTGIALGCILGITQTNLIMSLTGSSTGIMKANYIIKPAWIILFGAAALVISYMASMLIALRIRKISAYALASE